MPKTDNNPAIIPSMHQHRYSKNKFILVVVLVALGLAIAGVLYWKSNDTSSKNETKRFTYSYKKMDNFALTGPSAGSGIKFARPTEFNTPPAATPQAEQVTLTHDVSLDNTTLAIGRIAVASVVSELPSEDYLVTLDKALMNPKDKNYISMTTPLKNFVAGRIDSRYTVEFGSASRLTNANVKSNAWLIDFTATDKNTGTKTKTANFRGQAALLVGKKTYYYFMLGAVDYNWTTNSQAWDTVRNSLKIDQ